MLSRQIWAALVFCVSVAAGAEDWPTYQHDFYRSGVTSETLQVPLREVWRHTAAQPPQPAWPDPALRDFAAKGRYHRPRTVYDRAFHTAVAGGLVYFGSSADDRIVALDAATGVSRWSFITGGPVRLAPTVVSGKVYAGSDDGRVYCLEASSGSLVWQYSAAPEARWIPGNGRIISACPVRTGMALNKGTLYFGAGLFPEEGVFLCAVDAETGREIWKTAPDPMDFIERFSEQNASRNFGLSPQGYLLASEQGLYIPTGRTSPVAVSFANGEILGMLKCPVGEGGTYALLTPDTIVSGPGSQLSAFDAATQQPVATFPGRCMVVQGQTAYMLSDDSVAALDREKYRQGASSKESRGGEYLWRKSCAESYSMIVAGNLVIVGSQDEVVALRATDGEKAWSAPVDGKAYGLAAADGRLLVSTDTGAIHCFSAGEPAGSAPAAPGTPAPATADAAYVIKTAGKRAGYCVDLGCGAGALGVDIARNSGFKVVAVDDDKAVGQLRASLEGSGVYGTKLAAMAAPLERLPLTDYVADVVVCERTLADGSPAAPAEEAERLLRPCGGMIFLKACAGAKQWAARLKSCEVIVDDGQWLVLRRNPLEGSADWTHQYADAGNTGCSGDTLASATTRLQWFGLPGPRPMVDRHHRAMPPLVSRGRMFVPGDNCVIASDAYNGTPLWEVETPDNRRLASPRDSGHLAADGDLLYVAVHDECWVLDAATGERVATYAAPQLDRKEKRYWGYMAVAGDYLLGSGQRPEASYTTISTVGDFEIQWGDFKRLLTSDYLFCMDKKTGKVLWTREGGVFIHAAIAADSQRVYFIESRSRTAREDRNGRSTLKVLWEDSPEMAAVDAGTGKLAWEVPVDFSLCQHIIYLSCAKDTLVVTGSGNRENKAWYYLYGYDAATGQALWKADHPNNRGGIGGDHGEQIHHPVIAGEVVYAEPLAYALRTGEKLDWKMEGREGCGTMSASATCLFYRDGHPCGQNLVPPGPRTKLNHVTRPGCWINVIPASGLILIPEASSGCSCPYPLQTSLAYLPR